MDHDEPKQLKLANRAEGEGAKEKREKKEKEPKGNKGVILLILTITVVISLIFYFSGRKRVNSTESLPDRGGADQNAPFGGQKVYQF